jgi:hypothetical protein
MVTQAKCEVGSCTRKQARHGMCVVHAFTWLLTPGAAAGPERESHRLAFIARQETRHALKARTA